MHWVLGRRRTQTETAVEAARRSARATRGAAAVGVVAAIVALGGTIGAEMLDHDGSSVSSCTAVALNDLMYLYDDGTITHDEFERLRADVIADELDDVGTCESGRPRI